MPQWINDRAAIRTGACAPRQTGVLIAARRPTPDHGLSRRPPYYQPRPTTLQPANTPRFHCLTRGVREKGESKDFSCCHKSRMSKDRSSSMTDMLLITNWSVISDQTHILNWDTYVYDPNRISYNSFRFFFFFLRSINFIFVVNNRAAKVLSLQLAPLK